MCDNKCNNCGCEGSLPASITDDQLAEIEAVSNLHGKILELEPEEERESVLYSKLAYFTGFRRALQEAAEIALAGDAEIERLRSMIEVANAKLADAMRERDHVNASVRAERDYLHEQHRVILELLKSVHACIWNSSVRAECGLMIVTMEEYLK